MKYIILIFLMFAGLVAGAIPQFKGNAGIKFFGLAFLSGAGYFVLMFFGWITNAELPPGALSDLINPFFAAAAPFMPPVAVFVTSAGLSGSFWSLLRSA